MGSISREGLTEGEREKRKMGKAFSLSKKDCLPHLLQTEKNVIVFQGWTSDPGRDSQLEYRLSIYHARVNDTGSYTCATPEMKFHTINVIVKEVKGS